ncbi:MAG TPA: hypothetical protein VE201_08195, partial [Nitrospirales bacterium]|nr:hypothetical protein [Nitrospirales bacterium]
HRAEVLTSSKIKLGSESIYQECRQNRREVAMKMLTCRLSLLLSGLALVGMIGCGQEAPTGKAGAPDSTGQAIVDSVKTPLDKAHQVEDKLGKAADKTADTVKEATQ